MKIILGIIICLCSIGVIAKGVYQQPSAFLNEVFNSKPPKARMIWLTRARRLEISKILGHKPNRLRNKGRIELMKVLIFRETRGWEVRYPFFTNQFKGNKEKDFDTPLASLFGAYYNIIFSDAVGYWYFVKSY